MKNPNKRIALLLIALVGAVALLLTACGAPAYTDDLGREVKLDHIPERIVSTSPSLTEMLYLIGAGDSVVGRDDFSVYPEAVLDVPSFGTLYADFPAEAILGMEPDLVVAAEIISPEQVQSLEDLGLTVYWQSNPKNFDELYTNITNLAALMGREDQAAALVADMKARVKAIEAAVASTEDRPVVFYELDGTDPNNPWTTGSGTFVDLVLTTAGGVNAAAGVEGDYAQISSEALIQVDPDYIILGDSDFGTTPEMVAARGGWDTMAAVQNGNVYPFDSNLLSLPGPRLVDGLEAVARILHPGLFE